MFHLPATVQVEKDPNGKKKNSYICWKNAVYHVAFRVFLKDVARWSHVGYETVCGDDMSRIMFPFIHIVSMDYQEQ